MEGTRHTKKTPKKNQEASLMKREEANYRKVCANRGEKKKNSSKLLEHAEAKMLSAQKLKIDALSKEMVPGSRVSQDGRGSGEGRNDWCEVQGEAESKTMMVLAVQLANKGKK